MTKLLPLLKTLRCAASTVISGFLYDPAPSSPGSRFINQLYMASTMPDDALRVTYTWVSEHHTGCCFHCSTALAYLLGRAGLKVAIVTSPEGNAKKVSLAYVADGSLFVCDIVEAVKGATSLEECLAIPYPKFVDSVGGGVQLFDTATLDAPYVKALSYELANSSAEEFLRKELM